VTDSSGANGSGGGGGGAWLSKESSKSSLYGLFERLLFVDVDE